MDIHSKVVLVTGATGFTGFHLSKALKNKGAIVWGLSNAEKLPEDSHGLKVNLEDYGQVLNAVQKVRPDYIVHLAGISFAAHDNANPYYKDNVLGTQNLLDACIAAKLLPKKIIIASSAAVYGDPNTYLTSESQPFNPQGHYGCSKLSMEFIALSYAHKLPILLTRPFNYTGTKQESHFLIPKLVKYFKTREKTIELGNINIVREFSDVRDVVEAYVALMNQPKNGIVNLCSGVEYSFNKVIQTLKDITGHDIDIRVSRKFIRTTDIARLVGNPANLKNMIGNKYNYSLRDTLIWMLQNN